MTRPLTSVVAIAVLSAADLVFPHRNEPQQMPAGAAIGFVYLQRERIVACVCVPIQNRKNTLGEWIGEISYFLAHLADRAKLTAKLHPWFSDISRPILKTCYRVMECDAQLERVGFGQLGHGVPAIRPLMENAAHR